MGILRLQVFEVQGNEDVNLTFAADLPETSAEPVEDDDDGLSVAPDPDQATVDALLAKAGGASTGKSIKDWPDDDASGSEPDVVDLSSGSSDAGDAAGAAAKGKAALAPAPKVSGKGKEVPAAAAGLKRKQPSSGSPSSAPSRAEPAAKQQKLPFRRTRPTLDGVDG